MPLYIQYQTVPHYLYRVYTVYTILTYTHTVYTVYTTMITIGPAARYYNIQIDKISIFVYNIAID